MLLIKFVKFAIVGGTGALITFGITWVLTEQFDLWYMGSLVIATIVAMVSNFLFNNYWTFAVKTRQPSDADYEWFAYYQGNPIQRWWKRQISKIILEWIPKNNRLLEIGSGSSPTIGNYKNAVGIDINSEKIKFIQEKLPDIEFKATGNTKEFDNASFDNVICIEVLEHLEQPEKVVAEISRILKSGGMTVIATPDYDKKLWNIAEMFTPYKEEHCYKFNRERLEKMCKTYNLVPLKYKYVAKCDLVEIFLKIK